MTTWNIGLKHWTKDGDAYISVVFSWNFPQAYSLAAFYAAQGFYVRAGGPAVAVQPNYQKANR
jgi:hypothetical protein